METLDQQNNIKGYPQQEQPFATVFGNIGIAAIKAALLYKGSLSIQKKLREVKTKFA